MTWSLYLYDTCMTRSLQSHCCCGVLFTEIRYNTIPYNSAYVLPVSSIGRYQNICTSLDKSWPNTTISVPKLERHRGTELYRLSWVRLHVQFVHSFAFGSGAVRSFKEVAIHIVTFGPQYATIRINVMGTGTCHLDSVSAMSMVSATICDIQVYQMPNWYIAGIWWNNVCYFIARVVIFSNNL